MMNAIIRRLPQFFCLTFVLLLAACSTQKSLIVLLPEDGKPLGEVTVTNSRGSLILNKPWQAVEITGKDALPASPAMPDSSEVQGIFTEVLTAMPSPPVHYILYFRMNTAELTPESQHLVPEILNAIIKRYPAQLSVIGHTDTTGSDEYNYRLGLLRAKTVTDLLKSLGAAPSIIETSSHGKADLLVKTGDQTAEQRNRRVKVTIR